MSYILFLVLLAFASILIGEYRRVSSTIQKLREGCFVFLPGFAIPRFVSLNEREFDLEKIPTHFFVLLLLHEDDKFLSHWGFNWAEIVRALGDTISSRKRRGGSSITQQTAKNIFTRGDSSVKRKLIETIVTIILELRLTKEEILYLYLATIKFDFPISGLLAITRYLSINDPSLIKLGESEIIVSLLPAPTKGIQNLKRSGTAAYDYNCSYEKMLIVTRLLEDTKLDETQKGILQHKETIRQLLKQSRLICTAKASTDDEVRCIVKATVILERMQSTLQRIVTGEYPKSCAKFFLVGWQLALIHLVEEDVKFGNFPPDLSRNDERKIIMVAKRNRMFNFLSEDKVRHYGLTLVSSAMILEREKKDAMSQSDLCSRPLVAVLAKDDLTNDILSWPHIGRSVERLFSLN